MTMEPTVRQSVPDMTRLQKNMSAFIRAIAATSRPRKLVLRTGGVRVDELEIVERLEVEDCTRYANLFIANAHRDAQGKGPVAREYSLDFYLVGEREPRRFSFSVRPKRDERISIRVPAVLKKALDRDAEQQRRTVADVVIFMLEERYAKHTKGGK